MKPSLICLLVFTFSFSAKIPAQDKSDAKFGRISAKDFEKKVYSIDNSASAVVIADIGSSIMEGNTATGGFTLNFKRYRRVHILNKNGYDAADVSIPLFTSGNEEEKLEKVKAITYNLENGKVVETKLEAKSGIFKDRLDKNWIIKKFTLPNVKEGSIIEYEYTISSDFFFNYQPWRFQGVYPCLWSEYVAEIPQFFDFKFLSSGYKNFHIRKSDSRSGSYSINVASMSERSDVRQLPATINDYRWVMKDVPALKEEPFTSTLENHIAKIEFQLASVRYPNQMPIDIIGTWTKIGTDLLKDEDFGAQLNKNNNWLDDEMKLVIGTSKDPEEKARKVFAYLRDNYICTSSTGKYLTTNLRNTLKNKKGNAADINLLLICMLKHQNIEADPVLLGTRNHGITHSFYPILSQYNKVICAATINDKTYFLDATKPMMGFGFLSANCYNGHSRRINAVSPALYLHTDSLKERKVTSVILINKENSSVWTGAFSSLLGYYESLDLREKIKEKGKDEFVKELKKNYNMDIEIQQPVFDSLNNYDESVQLKYDFAIDNGSDDIIYFNPVLAEGYKENLFKSAERFYPVEMPYIFDETYILSVQVPTGYAVDEMPQPMVVKLNEQDDGLFEYRISESGGTISLRSRIRFNRSVYAPEEYELLREFFNLIVSKQSEQIVFKKKK